jgi:hypothetical protein
MMVLSVWGDQVTKRSGPHLGFRFIQPRSGLKSILSQKFLKVFRVINHMGSETVSLSLAAVGGMVVSMSSEDFLLEEASVLGQLHRDVPWCSL